MPGKVAECRRPFHNFTGTRFDYDVITGPAQDYRFITDRFRNLVAGEAQLQVVVTERFRNLVAGEAQLQVVVTARFRNLVAGLGYTRRFSVAYLVQCLVDKT